MTAQPKQPLESQTQAAVLDWARLTPMPKGPHIEEGARISRYLIAIPNDGKRSRRAGASAKQRGLVPGVSDLFLAAPAGKYPGFWLELKRRPNKLTPQQHHWLDRMNLAGYAIGIAYSYDEAVRLICLYLKIPTPPGIRQCEAS